MSTHFFRWQGFQVAVDRKPQVLRLAMTSVALWQEMRHDTVGRRRTEDGITVIEYDNGERYEGPLYPSVAALPEGTPFVSAAVLAQKAKAVDDGLVATLELLLDDGTIHLPGRAALLADLQRHLQGTWDRSPNDVRAAEAIGLLSATRSLTGDEDRNDVASWPVPLRLRRGRFLQEFRRKQEVDVPLGVYSWNERLTGLYRQGKALQEPLSAETASVLAEALESDQRLRATYEAHLAFCALTNPLVRPGVLSGQSLADDPESQPALFPASDTPEGRLVKRLVGTNPVPPGFDLIGELTARVTDGRISLATTERSGWYDHVLHALEPLLLPDQAPESTKLRLADDYRDDLNQLFRSLLGAARESHVKQIEMAAAGGCPLVVSPFLSFEPLAEHYRRRAASYRFIRERLNALLGEDVLLSRTRLRRRGESGTSLLDEMLFMEQLFTGAWAIVLDELGMTSDVPQHERQWVMTAKAAARSWASTHRNDADLGEDVRMMVPLFKDLGRDEFQVLAILGYEQRNLEATFAELPAVNVCDSRGRAVEHDVYWSEALYPLARPVTLTCRVKRLLDRDQFRTLCDREVTMSAIRSALQG